MPPSITLSLPLNENMNHKDHLITARSENDEIKAIAITSKDLVDYKRSLQNLSPISTAAIGRLMSAALMMGHWLKNESDTLTLEIAGDGELSHISAISNNAGEVRSYVSNPSVILPPNQAGHLNVGGAIGKGHLIVIRDLGLKTPYISQIDLQTGEIAEDLAYYFAQSEQTPSAIGLGVHFDKEKVVVDHAGGFLIQLMPNTSEETISILENNLKTIPSVTKMLEENEDSPKAILEIVMKGLNPLFEEEKDVSWKCNCSYERGLRVLSSLPSKDLQDLINEEKPVDLNCNFCGKSYSYDKSVLQEILAKRETKHE